MQDTFPTPARIAAAVIAICVMLSLMIQTTISLPEGGSHLLQFALLMRFFTIWTNFAAVLVMGWVAVKGDAEPRILFALATAIAIVALVYHALLSSEHHPVGLDWWTNQIFHSLAPLAVIIWWLAFSRPTQMGWLSIPWVMVVPIIYTVFAQIYGAATGFYPYFFLDLPELGWAMLLTNLIGLSLFFMLIAAALLGIRRVAIRLTSA